MPDKLHENLVILIVDDNKSDREELKRCLKNPMRTGTLEFHETDSALSALDMINSASYDCVFLDYLLPDMDGIELVKKLYDPETDLAGVPIVMLTGQGNESVMLHALRRGVQDYIVKGNLNPATIGIAMAKARELFELKKSRNQAEQQLQHMRRMEAIGELTSGIAHDFNNLLTVVIGNNHSLRRRVEKGPGEFDIEDVRKKIEAIDHAANKGADLVRRLMVFTRQSSLKHEIVDVNECVTETFELLTRTLGETIEIETVLTDELWPVSIDVREFENVLINLAVNARDAMKSKGKLTIETANIILDEAYALSNPEAMPGPYVLISVSDTGSGMDQETLKRIFEPFFTTKEAGEGTGLGLSMVYGFIKQSKGHIHVYSELGHGTVFRIYLPRVRVQTDADVAHIHPLPQGKETVLIAEDHDDVRAVAALMLERLGYKVLQAKNGRVALEMLKKDHKSIDIVFTDIVMPGGMTGIELVQNMREYYPNIKALYTSGYSENAIPDYQLSVGEELISKPYRRETLAQKIRQVLDGQEINHGNQKVHSGH